MYMYSHKSTNSWLVCLTLNRYCVNNSKTKENAVEEISSITSKIFAPLVLEALLCPLVRWPKGDTTRPVAPEKDNKVILETFLFYLCGNEKDNTGQEALRSFGLKVQFVIIKYVFWWIIETA